MKTITQTRKIFDFNSFLLSTIVLASPIALMNIASAESNQVENARLGLAQTPILNHLPGVSDSKLKTFIRDELYFGLSKPDGKIITELEWQLFLNRVIAPRFKDGLTVVDGYGHYLNSQGKLTREKTKIVIFLHPQNINYHQQIQEIISKYKNMFQQESVLRVTNRVELSF